MRESLLTTKLLAPQPRATLVARPRLLARLDEGMSRPLTLVAAPAGFGKTTLVAAWRAKSAQGLPVAWLTLDEADNDPARFLDYAIAALGMVLPGLGCNARSMLAESPTPPTEVVVTVLVNELADLDRDVALVLDDLHVIASDAVHRGLAFFLEHAPPRAHVVITTRADPPLPLARLRARDQVVEIRAEDLRFTLEEAAEFLRQSMGIAATPEQVAEIEARTEGWAAGLQLAALALRQRPDDPAVLDSFGGGHRYVLDYLAGEVLAGLEPETREFLLGTAPLHYLSGPLCDAVLGRDDSQAMIERLCAANLFVVALDDEGRWYRYHRLFRDFLLTRLAETRSPAEIARLHCRAGQWHAAHGYTRRAVADFLAAEDYPAAADLIERIADEMWLGERVPTLHAWLAELPEELFEQRPRLLLLRAWVTVLIGQSFLAVEPDLTRVEAALDAGGVDAAETVALRARIDTVRAAVASLRTDAGQAIALGERALAALPEDDVAWRAANLFNLGLARAARGAYSAAAEAFAGARAIGLASGDIYPVVAATVNLARALGAGGRLHEAERMYRRALDQADERGLRRMPLVGLAWIGLGELAHEWHDLAGAVEAIRHGLSTDDGLPLPLRVGMAGLLALARVQWDQGELAAATTSLQNAADLARRHHRPEYLTPIATYRARLALAAGDMAWLERWGPAVYATHLAGRSDPEGSREPKSDQGRAQPLGTHADRVSRALPPEPNPTRWDQTLTLGHWLARRARAGGPADDAEAARRVLLDLLAEVEAVGEPRYIVEVLIGLATAHALAGHTPAARATLRRALALAEPEDYVRVFLEAGEPVIGLIQALHASRSAVRQAPRADGLDPARSVGLAIVGPHEVSAPYLDQLLAAAGVAGRTVAADAGRTVAETDGAGVLGEEAQPTPSTFANAATGADRELLARDASVEPLAEPLTEREIEVLHLVAAGLSNREIAERMVVAVSTVKTHINHIYGKLAVSSRTRALAEARRRGLIA